MRREVREALERAKAAGFVYQGRWPNIADDYFTYCNRNQLPYVCIRARGGCVWASDVSVDMISTGKVLTPAACGKALGAIRRHADRRAMVMTGLEIVAADRVHP